ncbi:MAG: pantetheine-phosphate adenylyltransferase [Terriglobia bacterium]|nr:MAG: pantetheine-phosphate adenylyltransferase [Terriglobia bacterium]
MVLIVSLPDASEDPCFGPFPISTSVAISAKIVTIIPESENRLPSKSRSVVAIYPGSFDPITNGHLDLIERGSRLFDRLIVSVLRNETKAPPLFSASERMEMLREVLQDYPNVEVDSFAGLLVDYAAARSATVLLRGIRAISDYEYELQMALMNRRLQPKLETVFLLPNEAYSFISSRLVKEVFALGGNISPLVPASVEARLQRRLSKPKRKGA